MKIHITNLYNFDTNDVLVKKQHHIAEAGLSLGFREMGIFSFPVESDTTLELSKRLDGIIAALEAEDVVFIQLPTRNGQEYEKMLAQKIKAYKNTKLILLFHDIQLIAESNDVQADYLSLCQMSDAIIVPSEREVVKVQAQGIGRVLSMDDLNMKEVRVSSVDSGYNALCQSGFYIRKTLMDALEVAFELQNKQMQSVMRPLENEVQISFGLHDKNGDYSVWVGVTMQSVIEHTSAPVCFHILHDETLTSKNRERLIQVATQNGNRVKFHVFDNSKWSQLSERMGRYTVGAMFRIMLSEQFPEMDRIIYLDADLLVNRDMSELWNMDIADYCLAAAPDYPTSVGQGRPYPVKKGMVSANKYFNSGVLLMNLEQIRSKGKMSDKVFEFLENNPDAALPDQDALNVLYGEETLLVDGSWNVFTTSVRYDRSESLKEYVYHFASTGVNSYSLSEVDMAYLETLRRTPWGQEEGKKHEERGFRRLNDRISILEKVITSISESKKKRIFYGEETNAMQNMYQLLSIREGDYRILGEPQEEVNPVLPCRPFSMLEEEKEKFILFVLPEADNGTSLERLDKMGLKRDVDYFVIPCLLPPNKGGYM